MDTIFNHRSIRKYLDKPVDEMLLTRILEAGIRASNTGNMQAYSIIITRDEEIRKQLWEAHFKQNMVLEAPVHITFVADINRFGKWCELNDAEPGYDNFLWFYNATIDAVLASQNVCIEAEANGLGICYLGTATYNADMLVKILNLPEGVVPVAAIVLGYPADIPELTDRLPLNGVVHYEKYNDYSRQQIADIYAEKEGLPAMQKLLIENQVKNLAQIFTLKRYKKEDNLFFSKKFLGTLLKQGFMNH
jgi:FMN reductase (NADPH)